MVNIAKKIFSMKYIFTLFFIGLFFISGFAQQAGVNAYVGVTTMTNRVLAVTPNGTAHTGYHVGADGRLNSSRMTFIFGGRYTSIDLIPTSEPDYFNNTTKHNMGHFRVGLGWHLIQFSESFSITGKLLGQFDFNLGADDELLTSPYNQFVDASAGATAGLGIQFKFLTAHVEYEYGLINQFREQKETKADALSFSLGVFF